MIRIGDKLKLKFDVTAKCTTCAEGFKTKILGYRNSIVDVVDYDCVTGLYTVEDDKGSTMTVLPHQVIQLFVIPEYEQMLPYQEGWYLYKTTWDISPTYCKLVFVLDKLQIQSGDTGYSIDKMANFWWLRVA